MNKQAWVKYRGSEMQTKNMLVLFANKRNHIKIVTKGRVSLQYALISQNNVQTSK